MIRDRHVVREERDRLRRRPADAALHHRRSRAPDLADPPVAADPDVLGGAAELETRRLLHRRDLLGVGRDRARGALEVDDRLVVRRRLPRHGLAAEPLGRDEPLLERRQRLRRCRRATRSRSLRSPPAATRSIFSHFLPAGSCDENAGERMNMTYDPLCRSSTASIVTDWPPTRRPHAERDAAARLGAGARHRLPDAAAGGRHAHAERRGPDVGAPLRWRVTTGFVAACARDGEREQGDEGEGETAHVSQCTDGLGRPTIPALRPGGAPGRGRRP